MHDSKLTNNPPADGSEVVVKRPFDFQRHIHNQSQPELIPFVENLSRVVRSYGLDRFTVAEVGGDQAAEERQALTAGTERLNTSYGFDFLSAECLSPSLIIDALARWPGGEGEGWPSWAFSNHDAPRVVSRWGDLAANDDWARLLLALLMSLRGNVFLYQGEELGLPQAQISLERLRDPEAIANWPLTQGRDGARTPMPWSAEAPYAGFSDVEPWLPIPPTHVSRSVFRQNEDDKSVLSAARSLISIRRSSKPLREGDFRPLPLPAPLLGFDRVRGASRMRCLFNLSKADQPYEFSDGVDLVYTVGIIRRGAGVLGPMSACWMAMKG
jgi:alpha-glucosidase